MNADPGRSSDFIEISKPAVGAFRPAVWLFA